MASGCFGILRPQAEVVRSAAVSVAGGNLGCGGELQLWEVWLGCSKVWFLPGVAWSFCSAVGFFLALCGYWAGYLLSIWYGCTAWEAVLLLSETLSETRTLRG